MNDNPEKISAILCRLFAAIYREYGIKAKKLNIIDGNDEQAVSLPFPKKCLQPCVAPSPEEQSIKLNPSERCILRAVADMEEKSPTAEEIARAAKLKNSPHFRNLLSALRKRGLLNGDHKDQGYPISEAGKEAIEHYPDLQ
jgi:hypothetical protein